MNKTVPKSPGSCTKFAGKTIDRMFINKPFLILILSFLLIPYQSKGQCLLTSFDVPASVCSDERFDVTNTSIGGVKFEWDFCSGDLENSVTQSSEITNGIFNFPSFITLVNESQNWYGFVVSRFGKRIIRLDFGASLKNTPGITDLGTFQGAFVQPIDVEFFKENGIWYALMIDASTNKLWRLVFDSINDATPVLQPLDAFNGLNLLDIPVDLEIINEDNNIVALITNYNSSQITRVDFANSISNAPTGSNVLVPGSFHLQGITGLQTCSGWLVLVTSTDNHKVFSVKYNSGLTSSPFIAEVVPSGVSFSAPLGIDLAIDNGRVYAFVQSTAGDVYRLDDAETLTPLGQNLGKLSSLSSTNEGLKLVQSGTDWTAFLINIGLNRITRVDFAQPCSSSIQVSQQQNPTISFNQSGTYNISLKAYGTKGLVGTLSKSITVSSAVAPAIDIQLENASCVSTSNAIEAIVNSAASIVSYTWDLNDGNMASGQSISHQYSSAGLYNVALVIENSSGCHNLAKKEIKIFNKPVADFELPVASPFCTNQNYSFVNKSVFDVASNPTWDWRLNGTLVANTKDLFQAFNSPTAQEIRLKAKIPGCENEMNKNVSTVFSGPLTGFNFANGCQASPVPFANTTSGSVTAYAWNFGDGNTSISPNAVNTYLNAGTYTVSLTASNAAGCQNYLAKTATIYSKPQPDFTIALPPFSCAGSASQFTDLTPSPTDSNITNWTWGFGDAANGSSLVKNPSYTYATASTYNVSLAVATNFGCTNSVQKAVTIVPSPVAGFSNLPACVNQPTQFTDASSGNIKSRLWQIQGSTFTTPNPQYTYPSAGSFPVVLTVTGNNNCVSQATKNMVVPAVPTLDFSVQAPCANSLSVFTGLTTSADPSISNSWSFGSQGTGNGNPVQYTFSSTGTYVVRLSSTRQSGCIYSVSKNVSIVSPPVADFVPSIDAGAAPLPVVFNNSSSGANSYQWKFGDQNNSTSILVSPTFIFDELGDYLVQLTASNTVGCMSQSSKVINVVIPRIDLAISDFNLVKDLNDALQPVVTVINESNVTITDPTILIDIAGGSKVKKKMTGTLKPSQSITQTLDFQIVPHSINYVCAEVQMTGDVDLLQNRKCLSVTGEEILFSPYPNPAQAELNLDWISVGAAPVVVVVTSSHGIQVLQETIATKSDGLNRLSINTTTLSPGVYFVRFSDSKTTKSFTFVVKGN